MNDLNELAYFVKVVDHGGFAAAAKALGLQKSKLSRRISQLEARLGVRLIQRSTRAFAVTEIGQTYYQHCLAMLIEAEAAQDVINAARSEPSGLVRIACPPGLIAYHLDQVLANYLAENPKVSIYLKAFNRLVDPLSDGFDVVVTTNPANAASQSVTTRKLGQIEQKLVAAPVLLAQLAPIRAPSDLHKAPALVHSAIHTANDSFVHEWQLSQEDGMVSETLITPRLITDDLLAVRTAAIKGIGLAQIPALLIKSELENSSLVEVLPEWRSPPINVTALFASRRGLLPSVRGVIDHLVINCEPFR